MTPTRAPRLFAELCRPATLESAWDAVLAHYPREKLPQELVEFERRREARLRGLSVALEVGAYLPDATSMILLPKPGKNERRAIGLVKT